MPNRCLGYPAKKSRFRLDRLAHRCPRNCRAILFSVRCAMAGLPAVPSYVNRVHRQRKLLGPGPVPRAGPIPFLGLRNQAPSHGIRVQVINHSLQAFARRSGLWPAKAGQAPRRSNLPVLNLQRGPRIKYTVPEMQVCLAQGFSPFGSAVKGGHDEFKHVNGVIRQPLSEYKTPALGKFPHAVQNPAEQVIICNERRRVRFIRFHLQSTIFPASRGQAPCTPKRVNGITASASGTLPETRQCRRGYRVRPCCDQRSGRATA